MWIEWFTQLIQATFNYSFYSFYFFALSGTAKIDPQRPNQKICIIVATKLLGIH